jgi:hypothetical protein
MFVMNVVFVVEYFFFKSICNKIVSLALLIHFFAMWKLFSYWDRMSEGVFYRIINLRHHISM